MLAVLACAATALNVPASAPTNAHAALKPVQVLRTSGESVSLTNQWQSGERAVVVLMRSFG